MDSLYIVNRHSGKLGAETGFRSKPRKVHHQNPDFDSQLAAYVPSNKLKGKRALIASGEWGIDCAVATVFALEGATLAILYLEIEEQEKAQYIKAQVEKQGGEILLVSSDPNNAADYKSVGDRVVKALGGIDILVNNTATRHMQDTSRDSDICPGFQLTESVLRHMSSGSAIINTTSVGSPIGVPSAVFAFTRALSDQLVKRGIGVNAVAAGPIWIPPMTGVNGTPQNCHNLATLTPMDRLVYPIEVGTTYVSLAANESASMSGQILHPKGGVVVSDKISVDEMSPLDGAIIVFR